jgi:hypothetical protein
MTNRGSPIHQQEFLEAPSKVPFFRSRTILMLVHQEEDVAAVAALCALLGDLYRHRTLFQQEPMPVVRVAVTSMLRHYFCDDDDDDHRIRTWRAHEKSNDNTYQWKTHVGTPDSIWPLAKENDAGLLEDAFYGHCRNNKNKGNPLSHDDGGMADMILVGTSTSLTLTMWQTIAHMVEKLPHTMYDPSAVPPLVIATLGNLRGLDWLSRMAFFARSQEEEYATHDEKQTNPPSAFTTPTTLPVATKMILSARRRRRRPIVLVGFPSPLWYCRRIPDTQSVNPKKIPTRLSLENSLVLMVGQRSSSSISRQEVYVVQSSSTAMMAPPQQDHVLLLLRQTLFPPQTQLEIMTPSFFHPTIMAPTPTAVSTLYIYNLLWYLLQDPHMIQFPCTMAFFESPTATHDNKVVTGELQQRTLGALILAVVEEVLTVLHRLYAHTQHYSNNNNNNNNNNKTSELNDNDNLFCQHVLHPQHQSLLAKLLRTGGALLEDLTLNRMADVLPQSWRNHHHHHQKSGGKNHKKQSLWRQRWILEPLLTRAALSEWYCMTHESPYPDTIMTTTDALRQQICKETTNYGLGLVLQLGQLLEMEPDQEMANIQWVARQCGRLDGEDASSSYPLKAWGIHSMKDLENFLVHYPPFGKHSVQAYAPMSRL